MSLQEQRPPLFVIAKNFADEAISSLLNYFPKKEGFLKLMSKNYKGHKVSIAL